MADNTDLLQIIRDLDKRLAIIEQGAGNPSVTIDVDGKIQVKNSSGNLVSLISLNSNDDTIIEATDGKLVKIQLLKYDYGDTPEYLNNSVFLCGWNICLGAPVPVPASNSVVSYGIEFDTRPVVLCNAIGNSASGVLVYSGQALTDKYIVQPDSIEVDEFRAHAFCASGDAFDNENLYINWLAIGQVS